MATDLMNPPLPSPSPFFGVISLWSLSIGRGDNPESCHPSFRCVPPYLSPPAETPDVCFCIRAADTLRPVLLCAIFRS
jgi:hypothetical protein